MDFSSDRLQTFKIWSFETQLLFLFEFSRTGYIPEWTKYATQWNRQTTAIGYYSRKLLLQVFVKRLPFIRDLHRQCSLERYTGGTSLHESGIKKTYAHYTLRPTTDFRICKLFIFIWNRNTGNHRLISIRYRAMKIITLSAFLCRTASLRFYDALPLFGTNHTNHELIASRIRKSISNHTEWAS